MSFEGTAGSPLARLTYLLEELAKRFPDANQPFSSEPPELRFLAAIDQARKQARRYGTVKYHACLNYDEARNATFLAHGIDILGQDRIGRAIWNSRLTKRWTA